MIQREEERFMWSSCEKPAKPLRYAYAGHNPPPPVVFLGDASIEVAGKERKRARPQRSENRKWGGAQAQEPRSAISWHRCPGIPALHDTCAPGYRRAYPSGRWSGSATSRGTLRLANDRRQTEGA